MTIGRKPDKLSSIVPLAEKLADRIAARYPKVRFMLMKSELHPGSYLLYVLDAPRNEHSVLQLVSEEAADILVDRGVDIVVQPRTKRYTPDVLLVGPDGGQLAVEIRAGKRA
ncbi:MAG: hypothetical protein HY688_03560 [Chloroflexi bacterium]|nr:hypothetical protein [Chloroflexota bacterium]